MNVETTLCDAVETLNFDLNSFFAFQPPRNQQLQQLMTTIWLNWRLGRPDSFRPLSTLHPPFVVRFLFHLALVNCLFIKNRLCHWFCLEINFRLVVFFGYHCRFHRTLVFVWKLFQNDDKLSWNWFQWFYYRTLGIRRFDYRTMGCNV